MMRQSGAETLVTEEPYAFIAHVRVCGGAGWVTAGSTRKPTPTASARTSLRLLARLTASVRQLTDEGHDTDVMTVDREEDACTHGSL